MDSSSSNSNNKVKMFFFPHIAGGHLLPMIDIARFFAACHPNVQVTIITTPKNAQLFQPSIDIDRHSGLDISFHTLEPPNKPQSGLSNDVDENFFATSSVDQRTNALTSLKNLEEPLSRLLVDCRPDCLVSDLVQTWTLDVANEANVPWIMFYFTSLSTVCAEDCLAKYKPQYNVDSDTHPFLVTGLPHPVHFTKLRLPFWHRDSNNTFVPINLIHNTGLKSYAIIANSCSAFEEDYRSQAQNAMGATISMVGPVSLRSNRNVTDVNKNRQQVDYVLNWLDSQKPESVLYLCFGTEANFCKAQFHEIAHGLENSGRPFIWVGKPNLFQDQGEDGWFPEGFETRINDSDQGLIIQDWAPQLIILAHPNVGGFMTHCGWSSFHEGLCNQVPMITWPLSHDHFYIESLAVDVLKVGIRVGNEEWVALSDPPKVTVTRDKIEMAVSRVIGGGAEVDGIRRNVKEYAQKCRVAVQVGGSSYQDAYKLVEQLQTRKRNKNNDN